MEIIEKYEKLIKDGYCDKDLLIKENEINKISKYLTKFSDEDKAYGYTLPLVDTIGMNLYGKFHCSIKNI